MAYLYRFEKLHVFMKITKKIILILLAVFVLAQIFRPQKNNGDLMAINFFLAETLPPENVKKIFTATCFDCHSDYTKYPWYNHITPVNYWMANHIKQGTKHLNFSLWEKYSMRRKDHKLEEIVELVKNREMPWPSYTWTQPEATLTQDQINDIITWVKRVRLNYAIAPKPQ